MGYGMATQLLAGLEPATGTRPVFVDDTGRRRTRLRLVGRVMVALLGLYAALVIVGLTGSVSFPGVHLAELGRVADKTHHVQLGRGSAQIKVPALAGAATANRSSATPDRKSTAGSSPARNASSSGPQAPGRTGVIVPVTLPVPATTPTGSPTTVAHGRPSRSATTTTTTAPTATTTSVPGPPTTTRTHGQGPPTTTSNPGKGTRP